ncbi:MAG: diguanylate cyclase [Betaproteobacteria bacterium HGW-Betaproteobacteria-11]|nr:MAG: diguanylate cyclase [Betaproteobacteria bacterium HGW-Betaproteobacteria-11]
MAAAHARCQLETADFERILQFERNILQAVVFGENTQNILDRICGLAEALRPGATAAVLLLDEPAQSLSVRAMGQMSATEVARLNAVRPGPGVAECRNLLCGEASGFDLIQERSTACQYLCRFARESGYASCWSAAVKTTRQQAIGAFSLFSAEAKSPEPIHLLLLDIAAAIVGIVIEREEDEAARLRQSAEIHRLAFFDPLTRLPNRRLLADRLQHVLAASARHPAQSAVLFLDLDNFKLLNDSLGHEAGDEFLIEAARRLEDCVREIDTVARMGGDEFVVMLESLGSEVHKAAAAAEAVAEKIRQALAAPYQLRGAEHHSSVSIGICLFGGQDATVDEILKRADAAMYQAKRNGRNAVRFYDPAIQAALEARVLMEADLRLALAAGQFELHYQPQVSMSGRITGAEVLLRWHHPQRGLVSPTEFIPVAEETGLIHAVGDWVLEAALSQLAAWQAKQAKPAAMPLQLAINVSTRQLRRPDFVDAVRAALAKSGCNPEGVTLELTESLVMEELETAVSVMQALKQTGLRFAMDDFGTGYSSLAWLTRLPLDELKIDQSFVRELGAGGTAALIVQTIIGMARNLGLRVIAEGVESEAQRSFLQLHGCRNFQGYLFSRPLPCAEFEQRLAELS